MARQFTRRAFIGAAAATAGAIALPVRAAAPVRRLTVGRRTLEVKGKPAEVFSLTNESGGRGLILGPGEPFSVALENASGRATMVHWHGQTPAPELDGIAQTGYVSPIEPGETRDYEFSARPGTHWMHSHHAMQEQLLLTAPLIVQTAEDAAADVQEVVLLLNDFSFRDPVEILKGLTGGTAMDHGGGHGGAGGGHGSMNHSMDLNDVTYDAFLANDRTLDDPEVIRTERSGRVRLRIINGAASTGFWIDLAGADGTILAVDGNPVRPLTGSRFPLAQAQRMDLLVEVPAGAAVPVFARREGDVARTGIVLAARGARVPRYAGEAETMERALDLVLEEQLEALTPLPPRKPAAQYQVTLTGSMAPYVWRFDDRDWATRHKLRVRSGDRVEVRFSNRSAMSHPIHLHGHHFQVLQANGRKLNGAVRDTVLVSPNGVVVVAFDADNPGRWLYHCHNLYHMMTGMMSEVVYAGTET